LATLSPNCCLICLEFNTSDNSCKKSEDDKRTGSSGWNQEKVKLIVDNYLSHKYANVKDGFE
jgi:hypothetical protein